MCVGRGTLGWADSMKMTMQVWNLENYERIIIGIVRWRPKANLHKWQSRREAASEVVQHTYSHHFAVCIQAFTIRVELLNEITFILYVAKRWATVRLSGPCRHDMTRKTLKNRIPGTPAVLRRGFMCCENLEPRIKLLLEDRKLGTIFIHSDIRPTNLTLAVECRAAM